MERPHSRRVGTVSGQTLENNYLRDYRTAHEAVTTRSSALLLTIIKVSPTDNRTGGWSFQIVCIQLFAE
jgi:hypothetical protein